ncbi:thiamine pyrophosphokinase [Trichoderma guizhouense]|uniref:Thiamine pyrophosphokinase n=1 Tax=Trichoderma guizhouense TaxID=1491466 RepID=A0A1T3CFP6_9HYPO|nr:thiamine pyrophosphokinase [Trichoderma guizhouense]
MSKTNLDLICDTDKFPYSDDQTAEANSLRSRLFKLLWGDEDGQYAIGYVPDWVIDELSQTPEDIRGDMRLNKADRTVELFRTPQTEEERTRAVSVLTNHWREKGTFKTLKGWRDELWPVYARKGELLFSVERAAMGLFGTARYGVHMVAYVEDSTAPYGMKLWVPKRASNKSTFPGMLDNTVAGGLMTGEDPFECIIREADEEASLPDPLVRGTAEWVGNVTYIYITEAKYVGEDGYIYPECQWVYNLKLPVDVVPRPKDGEVEEFLLCDVDEVKRDLAAGKFKPNCALVMIDFFIRHGILTEANEPDLAAIKARMHRDLPFPGPHQPDWPGHNSKQSVKAA